MTKLTKYPVKIVREYIKKDYKARDCCYVCGSTEKLELHHLYSLSETWNKWLDSKNIRHLESNEQVMELRVDFAKECAEPLSNKHLITLCDIHHKQLHNIYGQRYSNHLAPKIQKWLDIQREKNGN